MPPRVSPSSGAYPAAVDRLIDALAALPGIGRRSAERLAFHLLKGDEASAMALSQAVADVKRTVRHCAVCMHLTDAGRDRCRICEDDRRDRSVVLVVEQPKDLIAIEQTGAYRGLFHVLMGRLSPLDGIGPGELSIEALLGRVREAGRNAGGVGICEVVLGLNPTLEGDGTALYLAERLRGLGVQVSRLARGLPSGTPLELANKAVLMDAVAGRQRVE